MRFLNLATTVGALSLCAPAQVKLDYGVFGAIEARAIGPAAMSGRIAAIAGNPKDPRIVYVGSAGGGVWKTINAGVTFRPVFDRYTQAIGAIAVDPANPDTVWVGTGEPWVRNSVSSGDGIYRTTDAGDNWQHVGLRESRHIARIVIDPKDPKTVYVAVLGDLWQSSEHRGLYKTSDAGKTWQKILYVNPDTGCSDVALDPQETQVLYAGMWQFRRKPWTFTSGGPGSGLYRSIDSGKTWEKISREKHGDGLPEGELGRIAVAISPARPSTVYALVEAKKSALLRSDDMGRSWTSVNTSSAMGERPFYFSLIVADPKDYRRLYKPGLLLNVSNDGGKSFQTLGASLTGQQFHPDLHALWIDPANAATLWLGTDGGVYKSYDEGRTWTFLRNLPVSQFYHVSYDMSRPFQVFGGLQDNGSWAGPSQAAGGIKNMEWKSVGIGDGFYVFAHPNDPDILYSQYQGGRLLRFHKSTGEIKSIMPKPKASEPKYRFNWNAAVALSPTDANVLYLGGQFVFRSRDKGESWEKISPDLTTNDSEKQKQQDSGGLTIDNSTAENHCTIYAIAESPRDSKVVWVGTDDGNLQLTRDGGKTWTNLTANLKGVPRFTQVSSIEASRFIPGAAYVTLDGHMLGDTAPYIFKTVDFGVTWSALATADIKGHAFVVREDTVKPDLLFLGTELGLYLTIDGGKQWAQFTGNLPNVAVRDIAIHPRDNSMILATHGRGIYIVDDLSPLRQLTPRIIESEFALLDPRPAPVRLPGSVQSYTGADEFVGANPQESAWITYYLKERQLTGDFTIEVLDTDGKVITNLAAGRRRGINRVPWPMRLRPPRVPRSNQLETSSLIGPVAPEGVYTVRLKRGSETYTTAVTLVADPRSPHAEADRKLQQQTVMRVYRLLERMGYVSACIQEARDQARERAGKSVKDESFKKELEAWAKQLDDLNSTLVAQREGRITGEEKLREMAGEMYGEVSRYGGRPTQSQLDRIALLEQEAEKANKDWEGLAARMDEINGKLKQAGAAPLTRLSFEAWQKRQ